MPQISNHTKKEDNVSDYKKLEIYRLSHDLAIKIHFMTLDLPRFELYEEGSQIRRSAKAIPSNIVEGFGRKRYKADYIRFLVYAHASCNETIEHLEILFKTGSFKDKEKYEYFIQQYNYLGGKLNRFIQAVEKR